MVAIRLSAFGGMQPVIDTKLLPQPAAELATNCWLLDGKITGFRAPKLVHILANTSAQCVFRIPKGGTSAAEILNSDWLEFDIANTTVVPNPNSDLVDPTYYWADGVNPPGYTSNARITGSLAPLVLGIPRPSVAPTLAPAGGVSAVLETRAYVYTWVSSFGEEGPPSPSSIVTTAKVDDTWVVTLTAPGGTDTTNRDLTHVNIYRTVTSDQGVATYFFVTQLAIATTTFNDTLLSATIALNSELLSTNWTAPPDKLQGMVSMPNGMIAGWLGKELWFCEPFRPHAWPVQYQTSVSSPIIGLGVSGQTLVVCTSGFPHTATGTHPSIMVLARLGQNEPCTAQGSVVSTQTGVVYTSPNGIISVANGVAQNVSSGLISKEKWNQMLDLNRIHAAILTGAYYCFSGISEGAFEPTAFNTDAFSNGISGGAPDGAFIHLDDARLAYVKLTNSVSTLNVLTDLWSGEVLLVVAGAVFQVDLTVAALQGGYIWRSKLFQMQYLTNLGAAKIFYTNPPGISSPVGVFRTFANGVLKQEHLIPVSGEMFRLPSGYTADEYQFEIEGNLLIENVQVADTPKALREI